MTVVGERLDWSFGFAAGGGPSRPVVGEPLDWSFEFAAGAGPSRPTGAQPWSARLVDQTGAVLALCPDAEITAPNLTFGDVEAWTVTIPPGTPAWQTVAVAAAGYGLGNIECQILRGARVWAWGPVVLDATIHPDQPLAVACRGAGYHLERTPLGVTQRRERLTDPTFSQGWEHWQALRTTVIGYQPPTDDTDEVLGFPALSDEDPGEIIRIVSGAPSSVSGKPNPPKPGRRMVEMRGQLLGELDGAQIYQQIPVEALAEDLEVTVRAAFFVPGGQPDRRTRQNAAVIVGLFRAPVSAADLFIPTMYRVPSWRENATELQLMDVAEWPDLPVQGRWYDVEATITIPARSGVWLIHAAFSPPRMLAYMSYPSVTYENRVGVRQKAAPEAVAEIVDLAQDRDTFGIGHRDRNIEVDYWNAGGRNVDRIWLEADHVYAWQAIRELVDEGLVECRWRYSTSERRLVARAPLDSYVGNRRARVVITDEHRTPGVVSAVPTINWSAGSGLVTVQQSTGGAEQNWGAPETGNPEWHETIMASDWVPRWRLPDYAEEQSLRARMPQTWEIVWGPGSPWVTGDAEVGDRFSMDVLLGGVRFWGMARAMVVAPDPSTDACTVTAWPEPNWWTAEVVA